MVAGTENSDAAVAGKFLAADGRGAEGAKRDPRKESGAREWYGDSVYGTGDLRGAIDDAGGDAAIKPKPLQAPVEGGFTVDDFTVDEQSGTVSCPAGNTRPLSRSRVASFGVLCRGCPCVSGAPRPAVAAESFCTNESTCCIKPVMTGLPTPSCGTGTARSGQMWNGSSPSSPAVAGDA